MTFATGDTVAVSSARGEFTGHVESVRLTHQVMSGTLIARAICRINGAAILYIGELRYRCDSPAWQWYDSHGNSVSLAFDSNTAGW